MLAPMSDPGATTDDAMLNALRAVPGGVWRTYLAPEVKVVFESLNKNACTSLKWMMADLAGEDLDTFVPGWQPFVIASESVHNRELWKASPRLDRLDPAAREDIRPENGWFIFAVVRDPRLRLFSAWQNKLLIETPNSQRWSSEWWYPRHPMTTESVIEDFAKFVDLFEKHPDHWLRANDAHFRDQVEMLAEDGVPYTRIYEISEMKELTRDLSEHLRAHGHSGELYIPRSNPTPLHAIGALFENGVKEQIERIYAADFERFGHLWSDFSRTEQAAPWARTDIAACENEAALGLRIAQLHRLARTERDAHAAAEKRIAELEAQLAEATTERGGRVRAGISRLRSGRS